MGAMQADTPPGEVAPAGQGVHASAELAGPCKNVLAGQGVHSMEGGALKKPGRQQAPAPATEKRPAPQGVAAPRRQLDPAGHGRQALAAVPPAAVANVPTAHAAQEAGGRAKVPAGQVFAAYAHEGAPTTLYLPASHAAHWGAAPQAAPPSPPSAHAALHVPAGQGAHTAAPPALVEPGGQGVQNSERATLAVPAGQLSHPPAPDEKVPAGHSTVHAAAPTALHVPAEQRAQK